MEQKISRVGAASPHVINPRLTNHFFRRQPDRNAEKTCQITPQLCQVAQSASITDVHGTWGGSVESCTATAQTVQLISWIRQHGGYVHPSLLIVDRAPCGCRGIVASRDICMPPGHHQCQQTHHQAWQLHDTQAVDNSAFSQLLDACGGHLAPVIAVPEELYMTTEDALEILSEVVLQGDNQLSNSKNSNTSSSDSRQSISLSSLLARLLSGRSLSNVKRQQQHLAASLAKLQPPLLLALLLAYERSKGRSSRWYPYISTLPDEPPCAWYQTLPPSRRDHHHHQQQQQPQQADPVIPVSKAAAAAVHSKCSRTVQMFGPALNISTEELIWAFGQVVSRAFGHGNDVGLAPLIDMLNHKQGAPTPQLLTVDTHQAATTPPPQAAAAATTSSTPTWHKQQGFSSIAQRFATDSSGTRPQVSTLTDCCSHASSTASFSTSSNAVLQGSQTRQKRFWAVCLAPQQQQQQLLSAGEELYISYITSCDVTTALLNFGFIPVEKMAVEK